jgi:predicted acylesterase/phospholipase RssA
MAHNGDSRLFSNRPGESAPGTGSADARGLRDFLLSAESAGLVGAVNDIHAALGLASAVGRAPDLNALRDSAQQVADSLHRALESASSPGLGPATWVGAEPAAEELFDALAYRARGAEILGVAAILMATGAGPPDRLMADFGRVAFALDPMSVLLGDLLGRRRADIDPLRPPPSLMDIQELLDRTCLLGVHHAGVRFGQAASAKPRPFSGAVIAGIVPASGCAGETVRITGSGFGATRPPNVTVMFPRRSDGCVAVQVTAWSDTEISVLLPAGVGHGMVGLTQWSAGFAEIGGAATQFAGELVSCLGPVAYVAAQKITQAAAQAGAASCPAGTNPAARFAGGPPVVKAFTVDGQPVAQIMPGDGVTVAWSVDGADDVAVLPLGGILPALSGPLDPVSGSAVVPAIALPDGTVGSWQLGASNRCGTAVATVSVVVNGRQGLVLSGGGAKGAFEVGAVRCLRDVAKVKFDVISAASAGALNGAKLAEGGAALWDLEALWLGMQDSSDLYVERAWFTALEPTLRSVFKSGSSSLAFEAAGFVASYVTNQILGGLAGAFGIPGLVYSIYTSLYPVTTGVIDLVRYYNAVQQALADPSIFLFTPVSQKIDSNIDPVKVAASGIALRVTAVALESGRARVFDEKGVMLGSGFAAPLRDVVKASASIPIAFPPIPIAGPNGTENYIDGGVRDNVPIGAAVEAGAHRIYAVLLNPTDVGPAPSFAGATMIALAGRAVSIMLDEAQVEDVDPFRGFGVPVTLIAPTFLVHDTLMVDPGLISINMDYGYLRAYDEVVADPADRAAMRLLSDQITTLRLEVWNLEHWANGQRLPDAVKSVLVPVPDPVALQQVRTAKKDVRAKVLQRVGMSDAASVPWNRSSWWRGWERHPWAPLNPAPWDAFSSQLGTLPAEAVPPG